MQDETNNLKAIPHWHERRGGCFKKNPGITFHRLIRLYILLYEFSKDKTVNIAPSL